MKKINWIDAYSQGDISPLKAYLLIHNKLPLKYIYRVGSGRSFDLKSIDYNVLKAQYPNAIITNMKMVVQDDENINETESPTIETEDGVLAEVFVNGKWHSFDITIYDENDIYLIDNRTITILHPDDENPEKLCKKLLSLLKVEKDTPKSKEIDLIGYSQGEYYNITSEINSVDIDIEENYNDDFLPVYQDILDFLNRRESGIIIARGEIGTGKTSLIRKLITDVPKHYIFITNGIAEHLGSPEFTSFLLENKDSVFILEDCEQILRKRTDLNFFSSGIANILNMSDGILSDIFNVKFICTFNADMNIIDEALLRKGRCFANYEFKKLCSEKTQKLLHKQGFDIENPQPMTLAEIYNFSDKDYNNKPRRKIGF